MKREDTTEILRRVDSALRNGCSAPELAAIGRLMLSCGGYDRAESICQDEHPPETGLAGLSVVQALPAPTQYLVASFGDIDPDEEGDDQRIPFDTGGGLLTQWTASAVTYDPGGYDASAIIKASAEVAIGWNGRENLITNGTQEAWLPVIQFGDGGSAWLPLARIVGNRDQLIVRARNVQPNIVPPSVPIRVKVSFGFLSVADIFAALARAGA